MPASSSARRTAVKSARAVAEDDALLLEQVGDGAGLAERAAVFGEEVAHVGAGAGAVVGGGLDEQRDAGGPVALVDDGLQRVGVAALAGALGDGALDVVLGHRS